MIRLSHLAAISLFAGSVSAQVSQNIDFATFDFRSLDASGEGFNDETPTSELEAAIVGNNPGNTLGELRRNVLEASGERWSQFLRSDVPIIVDVDFEDFGGVEGGSITLAGATAVTQSQNFANAPLRNTLYPIALANSLAGRDLSSRSDISVTVNSNEELSDSTGGSFTWYYGLDGNAPFGTIDFLNVIAHELGHGLGFAANVSSTSGNFFGGRPNAFTSQVFDTEVGLPWTQMTSAERVTSTRNDPNLTWNGPAVTNAVDGVQSFVSNGINFDASTVFAATPASFGAAFPLSGISKRLILVDDGVGIENENGEGTTADLAQPLLNGEEVAGAIALISRGLVNFDLKVQQAEDAGALAVVLFNNTGGTARLAPSSNSPNPPTIPVTFVSENSGAVLLDLLEEGELVVRAFGNRVELVLPEDQQAPARRLRLFAPSTFNPGSSVSHWTTASSPNLLMEPTITRSIRSDLDLTPLLMKDIGWRIDNVAIPHLTYETYLADLGLSAADAGLGPDEDFDNDGSSNLAEYFYGTNLVEGNPTPFRLEGGELVYQRAVLPNDLLFSYEGTTNLENAFRRLFLVEASTEVSSTLREVRAPIDLTAERAFFRLRIEENP